MRCMVFKSLIIFMMLMPVVADAQILSDSLVQAVGYWSRGEKQTYKVTTEKYRVTGTDTTGREKLQYTGELSVMDSTAEGYILEWHILNMQVSARNPVVVKLLTLQEGVRIRLRTNDVGVLTGLVNADDVYRHLTAGLPAVRKQFKGTAGLEKLIAPVEAGLENPETIETLATHDIRQLLMFHGAQYRMGKEIRSAVMIPGGYGGKALDGEVVTVLDEINSAGNNYILRATETVDRAQLKERMFESLSAGAMQSGGKAPRREDVGEVGMEIETGARLHGSGWVLYSFQAKTVGAGKAVSVEETVIEIR